MGKDNKTPIPEQPVPGTDAPEQDGAAENQQTTEVILADCLKEQVDRFENKLERLDDVISAFDQALKALASAKGMEPVALKPKKVYKPIKKVKKQ